MGIIVFSIVVISVPAAFADVQVSIPAGTFAPGCEETNECYIPAKVSVNVGERITWTNDDTAAHTVTSGLETTGPDGHFDSSLFMAGSEFEVEFREEGTFPYFCMVHPWMTGTVVVGDSGYFQLPDQDDLPQVVGGSDDEDIQKLKDEIRDLKHENRELKMEIDSLNDEIQSLKDQIVAMTNEFVDAIAQLNQWFRDNLN